VTPPDLPAGPHTPEPHPSAERLAELVAEVAAAPAALRAAVAGLTDAQLDTRYKSWTVRQIVHHVADSHANAYARFRLALTEDAPLIKPYHEGRWVELADAKTAPVGLSLTLLDALHARWVLLLRALAPADFAREYVHPEYGKRFSLAEAVGLYAHHGRHHAAQIAWLRQRHGW
jgi:hypothetical protein